MRRIGSLRMATAAVLLVGVTSIAFIVATLFENVEVSTLSQQMEDFVLADENNRRAIARNSADDVIQRGRRDSIIEENPETRDRLRKTTASGVDLIDDDGDRPDVDGRNSMTYQTDDWLLEQLPLSRSYSIWPTTKSGSRDDRVLAQLRYVPRSYNRSKVKVIYLPSGLGDLPPGRAKFISDRCPVDACSLTSSSRHHSTADILLLQGDAFFDINVYKPPNQIWVLWLLESPPNTPRFHNAERLINWTATYRSDSTIVTPYEKYVRFDSLNLLSVPDGNRRSQSKWPNRPADDVVIDASRTFFQKNHRWAKPTKNYAAGRTGLVAWFVSNCVANNARYAYVQELRRYIPVDVYGDCGELRCPRSRQIECDRIIRRRYKFYLAFENSNCEEYITEKLFRNALWNDVVPVVMGARKSDYEAVAPPQSFIHVDDFQSPRQLATYLQRLNDSDRQYNEYMAWKAPNTGRFIDTRFWCRLCAMAHDDSGHFTWYDDIERWWRNPDSCTIDRWHTSNKAVRLSD